MSRYRIPGFNPAWETWIGWDPPLQTYFAQVLDPTKEEDEEDYDLLWVGTWPQEVPTVETLAHLLQDWAVLPAGMAAQLEADRATSTQPSPLQRRMWAVMGTHEEQR